MKIKVQSLISISNSILFIIICLSILLIVEIYTSNAHTAIFCLLIFGLIIFSTHLNEYLSEIIINDDNIILICKTFFSKRSIKIQKEEIEVFNVSVNIKNEKSALYTNSAHSPKLTYLICEMNLSVKTRVGIYEFSVKPSLNIRLCDYDFFLRISDVSTKIPNFTKTINVSDYTSYNDIKYFLKNGKRLPFLKRLRITK